LSLVFERFTAAARGVVVRAHEAARELGHAHIGTEHQLLGLLADHGSSASVALDSVGVTAERVRERVLEIVPPGDHRSEGFLPFTPRAKKVFELSLREALGLGHRNITPEHLLLGLAHLRDGVAMRVLVGLGADEAAIRAAVLPLMPARVEAGPQIPRASQPQPGVVSSDPVVRRVLAAAAGRAVGDGRTEFGMSDLLAAVADDQEAARALASLGVDVEAMREAIERGATPEEPAA
jgi:ATP-dependent Clp protease ATP-binding subunit ClpC